MAVHLCTASFIVVRAYALTTIKLLKNSLKGCVAGGSVLTFSKIQVGVSKKWHKTVSVRIGN